MKSKYKINRAPHIKPSAQFAGSYAAAREDEERFETTQKGKRRKLKKGDH